MSERWGLTVPLPGVAPGAQADLLAELSGLGYTDLWSAETAGSDAFTPLALAAGAAPTARLGTAIVPVYTRGPALLAMSAASLANLAPGRFALGIGTSAPAIVQDWNATPLSRPYQRVRDTLRFLRRALAGDKVTERYETFEVRGFRLEQPPKQPPPILLAALRPGMLRLAGREADGAITNWLAADDVPKVRAALGDGPELVARIFVAPDGRPDEVRALGRRLVAGYLTVGAYARFHDWLGRGDALADMHRAWAAGDRAGAAAAVPDEVVDALIVHGTPRECRAHIARYVAAGVSTPVLATLPGHDAMRCARALAPAA
ncbi:MAG: LLM class F420-dependent oxidoreductase [Actinocatenispora sp.]